MSHPLLPIILCGGSGTRLWPLSRETYPKQFLTLMEDRSMLQQTVTRLKGLATHIPQASVPVLVCNEQHRFLLASQLMQIGVERCPILLEPAGRNTAPALTIAALYACASDEDPILLAMPADHMVSNKPAFHAAVEQAYTEACGASVVTFGVSPSRPETGYGYIRYRDTSESGALLIESFAEKPTAELARQYIENGNYLWNSGVFMMRSSIWLELMEKFRPDILAACKIAMNGARHDLDFIRPGADAFLSCPSDSIDYAVMERLPMMPEVGVKAQVVPLDAGWSDLGTWDALWEAKERDDQGNALMGDAVQSNCRNSFLVSNGRLVTGVGLENIVVVETADAVLVVKKDHTQEIKKLVVDLGDEGHGLAHSHRKVHRPWGWYDSLERGDRFNVKRIVVNPGASLSLQKHCHRAEHWIVVKGIAEVVKGEEKFLLRENESTYIGLEEIHRLKNPGDFPLEIIEVQSGDYLGEDDIIRFDDAYGRAGIF
ncbi:MULTISPECIES: mannose-1-phosphate guanylyltransferase/mannose-6-phosphate isomerase [Delftia]|nr:MULTISPECIES: mannose-1-phosphate guanylyltransferase/mannose-6-phosphate isomerase [Delftia]KAA9179489.1 mannose-1-phosphate guanylyltransferase/mannose-6-phosphate isomerase [Delftia sp. BR1]WEL97620.1 mannose-1-phosphate guanylyltransferase/mannose-6-phosphate isomerase [Delftia tsuruhatensis]WQM84193.1 mannose-1-phosphate guanylyltransferase/mannose-6-phosphate isomerase [Delftia tsuruhatensis]